MWIISRMAMGVSVVLCCFSARPCVAQQEIKLTKSVTMLPDRPSGIVMITKFWNEELNQNSHFVLTFLTDPTFPAQRGYLERVPSLAADKPVDFKIWEGADCSLSQTLLFRVGSKNRSTLVVGRAVPTGDRIVNGEVVLALSDPSVQRIQIFVPRKPKADDYHMPNLWLDSVAETVTEQKLCTVAEVRDAIRTFVRGKMATLTSQQ